MGSGLLCLGRWASSEDGLACEDLFAVQDFLEGLDTELGGVGFLYGDLVAVIDLTSEDGFLEG